MKKIFKLSIAVLLAVLLFIPSVFFISYYTKPMEDVSYNLSLIPEDGQEWKGNKGWTVFKEEGGTRTELVSDGFGGYQGLDRLGQTFYYSRKLKEKLDSPTLQIGAVNRTVSIFLDDTMIYTDCPELDNRIGYLNLPMLEYDRAEPVTVSLPPDYLGKTLTIAQSSPMFSETQSDTITVWPCDVKLYCGYAYESSLIASTAKTMLPAVRLFSLEIFLLAAFIWSACTQKTKFSLLAFALTVLFQFCGVLSQADFFYQYFGLLPIDPVWFCFHLSIGSLLLFIALYGKYFRPLFFTVTAFEWGSILLYILPQLLKSFQDDSLNLFLNDLPQRIGFLALLGMLIGVFLEWKKGVSFFRYMALTSLTLIAGYVAVLIVSFFLSPDYLSSVFTRLSGEIQMVLPNFTLKLLWELILFSTFVAVILELIEHESERRAELAVLTQKNELALESYENLQQQSEETRILRHDMMKHYSFLRTLSQDAPEKIAGYLDEIIGQIQTIRPVVSTRNQVLNILLNGKLNAASAKGIAIEIERSDAPEALPLTDSEACCLFLNILENALHAASASEAEPPYIRLDFHCKNQHFVFSCENSKSEKINDNKKIPAQMHGYGLKIIHQIMNRWGDNMISVEQTDTTYKITIIIPLSN